jgi:hypothetical protein
MYYVLFLDRVKRPHWNRFGSVEIFKGWYSGNEAEGIPRRDLLAIAGTSRTEEEIRRLWDKYDAKSERRRSPSLCSREIISMFEKIFEQLDADGNLFA